MNEREFKTVDLQCALCKEYKPQKSVLYWYDLPQAMEDEENFWCTYSCNECTIKALKAYELQRNTGD